MSCSCRWAYGFLSAFRRSLSATRIPMWSGALARAHVGADVRGEVAAGAGVHRRLERDRQRQRPHGLALGLLLEGDREHPLVDARPATSWLATIAVEPPTEPAVCTRNSGLPTAPSASARNSSGIITPSKKSGALPMHDRVDVGPGHLGVGRARGSPPRGRARPSTRRHVSPGACVWPMPTTATRSFAISSPLPARRRGSAAGTGPRGVGDAAVWPRRR